MPEYKIAKLSDQVYEIQDFITEEELDQVMQFINLAKDSDWFAQDVEYKFWQDKVFDASKISTNSMFISFYHRIKDLFSSNIDLSGINLQRYMINDFLDKHTDDHEGHRITNQKVFYGGVLYYNDDYLGGELNYPDLDIVHKPKARSLVLHSGKILHGTLPVKSNSVRYISTVFAKHNLDENVFLNKDVFGEIDGL